jgi:hypothetical protein
MTTMMAMKAMTPEQRRRLGSAMTHRTVRDIELELQRVKLELQRIVQEEGERLCTRMGMLESKARRAR